jgi:hypothetical protein
MILNITQVFIAIPIPCIIIICPFSSSHFATQIFPIDELLKPYILIENYVLNRTVGGQIKLGHLKFNLCKSDH